MADFEETLNQILSSPQAMEQIMSLAGSLSGELGSRNVPAQGDGSAPQQAGDGGDGNVPQQASPGLPAGFPALSGLDPALLGRFLPLVKVYQQGGDDKTRLLEAMRPFLKPERAGKLDQAIRITRLSRVIRAAMELFRGDGNV